MRLHKKSSLFITFGLLLLVSAIMLTTYNRILEFNANKASNNIFEQLVNVKAETSKETFKYIDNPNVEMPVRKVYEYDCIGTLEISSLKLKLPVMSEWDYSKLRISPCRYTGSVYQNNLIICAHNYKKHFGKIKTLKVGDLVSFTDMSGNVFRFKVSDIETVKPNAPENMTSGNWDLTLFTCTVGGTSRVTVRCIRESENSFGI